MPCNAEEKLRHQQKSFIMYDCSSSSSFVMRGWCGGVMAMVVVCGERVPNITLFSNNNALFIAHNSPLLLYLLFPHLLSNAV
jgi:hypothetical protein